MDNIGVVIEAKKYIREVLGGTDIELSDSICEQLAELYLESLASLNINVENVLADDLVKNEDLVWSCYDKYMSQPEKKQGQAFMYEEPIDYQIKNRMYVENMYGSIATDEYGLNQEEYNEGLKR